MLHFYALIITQIVAESLPISSSGHEILVSCLMRWLDPNLIISPLIYSDTLSYFFNMPTIIIVPIFFVQRWWPVLVSWRRSWPLIIRIAYYAWIASAVTACMFLMIRSSDFRMPLWIGFALTGVLLFSLRFVSRSTHTSLSVWYAIILGLVQGCAAFPGLSRLAAVYVAARWLGFSAHKAFQVAWLIQWPLVLGASGVSLLMLYANPSMAGFISPQLLGVMLVAAIISYVFLCVTYKAACTNRLYWVSAYMIIPVLLSYWCA